MNISKLQDIIDELLNSDYDTYLNVSVVNKKKYIQIEKRSFNNGCVHVTNNQIECVYSGIIVQSIPFNSMNIKHINFPLLIDSCLCLGLALDTISEPFDTVKIEFNPL